MPLKCVGIPICVVLVLLSVCIAVTTEEGGGLIYFRSNGGVSGARAASVPEQLDSQEVLQWRTPLDSGHSSPIVCNGRIFLTTFNPAKEELATLAFAEATGKILWKQIVPIVRVEQYHPFTGSAAQATPACDGRRIFVFFGSYGLICYDLEGKLLWEHAVGPFQDDYGSASSPVLIEDKVVIQQDHDVGSFLMALNAENGKVLWKSARPDAVRSYSTPAVWMRNGRKELLVAGGLELAGYDPSDGKRLWWIHGLARLVIPTPVPLGDRVYMTSWSPGGDAVGHTQIESWPEALRWDRNSDGKLSKYEVRNPDVMARFSSMDSNQNGELEKEEWDRYASVFRNAQNGTLAIKPSTINGEQSDGAIIWRYPKGASYVATPLLDQGVLWLVKDGGIVTTISAESGKVLQEKRLQAMGNYYASPVSAGHKIFFANEQGVVSIVADDSDWRLISTHAFREKIYATPLVIGGKLFIRTEKALYCFGIGVKPGQVMK